MPRIVVFAVSFASAGRPLKNDVIHGLTVSPPNRDKLTMRTTR
jgi:hypothetical protein